MEWICGMRRKDGTKVLGLRIRQTVTIYTFTGEKKIQGLGIICVKVEITFLNLIFFEG